MGVLLVCVGKERSLMGNNHSHSKKHATRGVCNNPVTCSSKSLQCVLSNYNSGIPEYRVKYYVREILKAVSDLHAKDKALLNLSLESIFVDLQNKKVKLFHEGSSKSPRENTKPENSLKNSQYLSPEVARGKSDSLDGKKADIWAVGVIMYTLLVSKLPLDCGKHFSASNCSFELEKPLSQEGQAFLQRLIEPSPEKRADALELLKDPWLNS